MTAMNMRGAGGIEGSANAGTTITARATSDAVTDVTSGWRASGWLRAFHTDAGVR